jgi:hypothetical protein
VGAGRGPPHAGPGRETGPSGTGETSCFPPQFHLGGLDASDDNLLIACDAGGWASATMVDEVYGHVDVHDPAFDAAVRAVWGEVR